jgi:hypothetical protein
MLMAIIRDDEGRVVGVVPLAPKAFKTGSNGFLGQAKLVLADGTKCQAQVTVVAIGSRGSRQDAGAATQMP